MALRSFIDLDLSFTVHPVKKDLFVLSDAEAIKNAIKNLVLTQHYEKKFHPEIGCLATSMLFENATPITAINLAQSIENVIENYEKRALLKDIRVEVREDENGYLAIIEFYIKNVLEPIVFDLYLERMR